jgi:serine protease Do
VAFLEMSHRRVKPSRLSILMMLLAALAFAKWNQASDHSPPPVASTPTDIAALRALQARVQAATRKVLPAIVAVRNAEPLVDDKPHIYKQYCSGVIITVDGLVLSQFHVSHRYTWNGKEPVRSRQPGERTTVILSDGREVKAELLGADQTYDLSLVRLLEPGPYACVPLELETAVRLGDWVLKLGHPIGYRRDRPPVVRLGRVLFQESELFVTDCNTTGGDSGGPLIDLDGRFVGMIGDSGIPPKLKTKTMPAPEWLFNCGTSSVVRRCLPSMLRGRNVAARYQRLGEKK